MLSESHDMKLAPFRTCLKLQHLTCGRHMSAECRIRAAEAEKQARREAGTLVEQEKIFTLLFLWPCNLLTGLKEAGDRWYSRGRGRGAGHSWVKAARSP